MAEQTGFLYPFLDSGADDATALLVDLGRSATAKWEASVELRRRTMAAVGPELAAAAADLADRVRSGARIFVFGNGGSAADADAFVHRCASASSPPLPAVSLVAEPAVLTALANDIGIDVVFARQLEAHAHAGDVAVAFSTSGGSTNVLAALHRAPGLGLVTVGIAGYGGGAMAGHVDHCLAVASDSVHRVQEAQTALADALIAAVADRLAEGSAG